MGVRSQAGVRVPTARRDRLPGWAYRIRTRESVRGLPDWVYVSIWPEVGASAAAETLRVPAEWYRFAARGEVATDRRRAQRTDLAPSKGERGYILETETSIARLSCKMQ